VTVGLLGVLGWVFTAGLHKQHLVVWRWVQGLVQKPPR